MAAELRWILLGLSFLLLAGIWWWGARRTGQAPGNAELRESSVGRVPETAPPPAPAVDLIPHPAAAEHARPDSQSRDWGVSPFEPLSIRTADYEHVPVLDGPMMVHADPMDMSDFETLSGAVAAPQSIATPPESDLEIDIEIELGLEPELPPQPIKPSAATPPTVARASVTPAIVTPINVTPLKATPPQATPLKATPLKATPPQATPPRVATLRPAAAAPAPKAAELQKIVIVRVCGVGNTLWPGTQLLAALEAQGLSFGRYQVFHRNHVDGRSLFCVASLIEPGTFDIAAMAGQEFRGVTLFAVLPGPVQPLDCLDELLATARGLAEQLSGMLQDAKGMPLSPQRAAELRENIARFQALL